MPENKPTQQTSDADIRNSAIVGDLREQLTQVSDRAAALRGELALATSKLDRSQAIIDQLQAEVDRLKKESGK